MSKILMSNGEYYDYSQPWESEYDVLTVAQALSNICRFNGHTREFYSVAQHCVEMSNLVPPNYALAALMHDAHEAFVGDVPTPLKRLLGQQFADIDLLAQLNIATRFGIPYNSLTSKVIKNADMIMLSTERRDLLPPHFNDDVWPQLPQPITSRIVPWDCRKANHEFIKRYETLIDYNRH